MIVGCKQDLERVELPFVEIEALVTIIKMINILLIITIKMMKISPMSSSTTIIKMINIVLILLVIRKNKTLTLLKISTLLTTR